MAFVNGLMAWQQGDFDAAARFAQQAIFIVGDDPAHFNLLGACRYRQGQLDEAVAAYQRAIAVDANFSGAYTNLCLTLSDLGRFADAEAAGRRAITLAPDAADAHCNLGIALVRLNKIEEAKAAFERAIACEPNHLFAKRNMGHIFKEQGQFADAQRMYEEVLRQNPRDGQAYEKLAQLRRYTASDQSKCSALEAVLLDPSLPLVERIHFHFALGKMYEDMGRYDDAFRHLQAANQGCSTGRFDRVAHMAFVRSSIDYFAASRFSAPTATQSSSEQLVFVVGMFRSGTTLVEQILASHPDVFGAGELMDVPQFVVDLPQLTNGQEFPLCLDALSNATLQNVADGYWQRRRRDAGGRRVIIDKMPKNFLSLGLIAQLFPRAKVIHCRRDPRDVCVSCYANNFTSRPAYSHDLRDLGFFYRCYEQMMRHWSQVLPLPMLEIQYEELIRDQAGVTQKMLDFCGLSWNPACLEFHKTKRIVATASDWQVRQPLFDSSVGRWKKFESHLGPLLDEIAKSPAF